MKVAVLTLGCKVNIYESEYIISKLKENNFDIVSFNDKADIYIINTCSVTNTSDKKSRKMIQKARMNKDAIVIAMGCHSQINDEIDADIIIGNKDKSKIIELIDDYYKNKQKIAVIEDNFDNSFEDMMITSYENRTRAFVKIQDGCENFCSYCIIPFVRGKCRSKEFNKVIEEIKILTGNGFKEIVLTGIHTGNYGVDINSNFASLLREIIKIKDLFRLRISSIEINELTDEVLEIIKDNDIIVNHLHIPIQSASDNVLQKMNRKYNLEFYKEKIKRIKTIKKDINITTDIIVGHPYEEDIDFSSGIDVIKEIGFSKLHVFPYSRRKDTKSDLMPQVDEKVKKQRARKLLELSKELEISYMKRFLNKELEVLIEKSTDKYSIGHTTNYLNAKIYNKKYNSGDLVKITLKDIDYPFIIGE